MNFPPVAAASALKSNPSLSFARARLHGAVSDVVTGLTGSIGNSTQVCHFTVTTSLFSIPDEAPQLPRSSPRSATPTLGNVHVVRAFGSYAFVKELTELLVQSAPVVELCGHYHVEPYKGTSSSQRLLSPTITVSQRHLWSTEEMLRVLHASQGDTKDIQSRLQQIVFLK